MRRWCWLVLVSAAACSGSSVPVGWSPVPAVEPPAPTVEATAADAAPLTDAGVDAAPADAAPACQWSGAPGQCLASASCSAIADHSPEPSASCPAGQECCIDTPDVGDNPPIPVGYQGMMQSQVTPAMTSWAVMILHDPITYPMFSTTTMTFGTLDVLARVEWHPPDFQNGVVHRGVTLYVPK
jgi:hypothetical protein